MSTQPWLKRLVSLTLDNVLSPADRLRLAYFILNRENGEGIGDPLLNGEEDLLDRLRPRLGPASVVFDVGANIGEWTSSLAKGLPRGVTIYPFEPVPEIHAALSANVAALENVIPVQAALSDRTAEAEIHLAGRFAGSNSLHHIPGVTEGGVATIRLMRGDDFCRERGIDAIDLLKIDVEGNEVATLRGFESLLAARKIGCVQFEYGGTWIASRTFLADAFQLLARHGYRIARIVPGGVRPLARYEPSMESFRYANYLAVNERFRWLLEPAR
ncbi:MAG: FkbM family methyltransferase [Sandaracinaceae bacterium]|jgi:FkbM family methyltransferase|nr:FkbM family methyltransferase [Sandaracinaceae bacterium]